MGLFEKVMTEKKVHHGFADNNCGNCVCFDNCPHKEERDTEYARIGVTYQRLWCWRHSQFRANGTCPYNAAFCPQFKEGHCKSKEDYDNCPNI